MSIVALVATAAARGVGPAKADNYVCQAATNGEHCYAINRWGSQSGGAPVSFSEVGLDLEFDCLTIGNLAADFVNFETWMFTNANYSHSNLTWVESGYKDGAGFYGLQSFVPYKFWADQRAPNGSFNYAEHFISNTDAKVFLDTVFQWVPNTGNWKVFNNHQLVGTSSGVGAFAGGSDVGLEFTDTKVAAVGNGSNWRYKDGVNGTFRSAPAGTNDVTSGTNAVITHFGGNAAAHTSNSCSYPQSAAVSPNPVSPESAATEIAASFAQEYGGSPATSASSVATTRSAANALQGSDVVGDQPVVMLEVKGNFTARHASAPKGVRSGAIKGNTLTADFDSNTGQLLDWRISSESHSLASLGRVTNRQDAANAD